MQRGGGGALTNMAEGKTKQGQKLIIIKTLNSTPDAYPFLFDLSLLSKTTLFNFIVLRKKTMFLAGGPFY